MARNATANIFNETKEKLFTVSAGTGNTGVAQTADTELINGQIASYEYAIASNDPDVYIANVSLAASTGIVTIRLSANTTADVVVRVMVKLASGEIA